MFKYLTKKFTPNSKSSFAVNKMERNELCEQIIDSSTPRGGFYLLLILSTFIVVIGLLKNSLILIIGGMLVAPLLSPLLSISLAITIANMKVFFRSIKILSIAFIISLIVAYLLGRIAIFEIKHIDLVEFMKPDLTIFLIAVAAGAAASFAWAKKELNSSLPGVAITATLLPPLTTAGLALAVNNHTIAQQSILVYLLNVVGIILGSLIIFILMDFNKAKKKLITKVKEEENTNN